MMTEILAIVVMVIVGIAIIGPKLSYYIKLFKPKFRVKTVLVNNGTGNKYQAQFKRTLYQNWVTIGYDWVGSSDSGGFVFSLKVDNIELKLYDTFENAEEVCLSYKEHLRVLNEPRIYYTEVCDDE